MTRAARSRPACTSATDQPSGAVTAQEGVAGCPVLGQHLRRPLQPRAALRRALRAASRRVVGLVGLFGDGSDGDSRGCAQLVVHAAHDARRKCRGWLGREQDALPAANSRSGFSHRPTPCPAATGGGGVSERVTCRPVGSLHHHGSATTRPPRPGVEAAGPLRHDRPSPIRCGGGDARTHRVESGKDATTPTREDNRAGHHGGSIRTGCLHTRP